FEKFWSPSLSFALKRKMTDNKKILVLVTGASGFIAGHIMQQLCEQGYQVRATVRRFDKSSHEYLLDLAKRPNQIEFVNCDLTSDENWDKAMKGVKYVIHTASPMPNTETGEKGKGTKRPITDDDYIIPAVDGMNRVLNAILNHGKSVERM
ncbi:cinnamoyl CoA reductase, partial [Reticulomyxa filosa]